MNPESLWCGIFFVFGIFLGVRVIGKRIYGTAYKMYSDEIFKQYKKALEQQEQKYKNLEK